MKKLIKSYRFWTALAGSLGLLVVSIAKLFGYSMSSVVVEELVMAVCGVLVVFGIVTKPDTQESTTETKEEDSTNQPGDDLSEDATVFEQSCDEQDIDKI